MKQFNARQSYEIKTNYVVDLGTRTRALEARIKTATAMGAFWLAAELMIERTQLTAMKNTVNESVMQDIPW